ncbi:MAG: S9 family peptidase [Deltaproteobacteria bacterium]|nr:MAG: S9 family peptidase [Deltaproteobacteria bacterium]
MSVKPRPARPRRTRRLDRPPATRRELRVDRIHGVEVADPYRWLEDATRPEVRRWIDRQDAFARRYLASLPDRDALRDRLDARLRYDAVSPPLRRGGRLFYTRRHKHRDKAVVYWRPAGSAVDGERVLFDPNAWSDDGRTSLGVWVPSPDGRLVAYARRENAADEATLFVRDVATGRDRPDVIPGARYAQPAWLPDGSGFYYTWVPPADAGIDPSERPGHAEIRFHEVGGDPSRDRIVVPASGDPQRFVGASVSRDGQLLVVTVMHGWRSTDVYVQDLAAGGPLVPLVEGRDANYWVHAYRGRLYILTDEDAPRYRVLCAEAARLARDAWREIVPESDATIESMQVIGGRLVVCRLRNAASALQIWSVDGTQMHEVELPGLGTVEAVTGDEEDDDAYFTYSSFVDPPRVMRASVRTGATQVWARVDFPADTSDYTVDQVWYPSADGTRVSMFVIRRRDLARTGDNPTVLYGYGGFNVSLSPVFSPSLIAWLERGGVYAIPNLRGGGEYGEAWHRAGMLDRKQTVFDDFIAAAEHLIREGYTRPERLAIRGGSNGGLLVGAAMTQRPELFRAVVCAVPLLDMVRYHRFGSGRTWIPEYGDPDDPDAFRWLVAYSPYHHVRDGVAYPALLMLSADSDDRVDPMHARKFVAAVQRATSSRRPVLLRIERHAGHGGADRLRQDIEQLADTYAFLCAELAVRGHA